MKSATFPWAALAAAGMLFAQFSPSRSRATEYRGAGKDLYAAHCAMCHGAGGKGDGRGADLTESDLADETDAALIRKVMDTPRPMPKFETEIQQMIQPLLLERASPD